MEVGPWRHTPIGTGTHTYMKQRAVPPARASVRAYVCVITLCYRGACSRGLLGVAPETLHSKTTPLAAAHLEGIAAEGALGSHWWSLVGVH